MTDLEKFIALYAELGIKLEPKINEGTREDGYQYLHLKAGWKQDKDDFDGYSGFYSNIYFDETGKFLSQGFWE